MSRPRAVSFLLLVTLPAAAIAMLSLSGDRNASEHPGWWKAAILLALPIYVLARINLGLALAGILIATGVQLTVLQLNLAGSLHRDTLSTTGYTWIGFVTLAFVAVTVLARAAAAKRV